MVYATWSKPAPPSDSGNATPVKPSSAAFLKSSRGKRPVSSSSFAIGRTSDSANSRTLFCSSFCSSVSSRSTVSDSSSAKTDAIQVRLATLLRSGKRLREAFVSCRKVFRVNARLSDYGHEIRIAHPARQCVKVQMPEHTSAGSASQIHSQVHAIAFVIIAQNCFHSLRQPHHLAQRFGVTQVQFRHVLVGDDHNVPRRVGEPVQNHKRLRAAMNNQRLGVVLPRQRIAKNAFRMLPAGHSLHVLVAPRSPDVVHRNESFALIAAR